MDRPGWYWMKVHACPVPEKWVIGYFDGQSIFVPGLAADSHRGRDLLAVGPMLLYPCSNW